MNTLFGHIREMLLISISEVYYYYHAHSHAHTYTHHIYISVCWITECNIFFIYIYICRFNIHSRTSWWNSSYTKTLFPSLQSWRYFWNNLFVSVSYFTSCTVVEYCIMHSTTWCFPNFFWMTTFTKYCANFTFLLFNRD